MQLDTEDQADNKQAVDDDGDKRGEFYSGGVRDEFLDVVRQRLAFLEGVPGTVQEDVSHPRMVWIGRREVLSVHEVEIAKDVIDDTESRF